MTNRLMSGSRLSIIPLIIHNAKKRQQKMFDSEQIILKMHLRTENCRLAGWITHPMLLELGGFASY